jgi:RHS repeat-associated protein
MANDYTYDANHRLTQMDNTLYNPSPQTGSYSTQYTYDDAGNILTLKRRGLVPPLSSPPVYGAIDELTYSYNDPLNPQEKSRLQSITDAIMDANAQPEGFKGNQNPGDAIPDKASTFEYDKNGNLIYDGGKELTIDYNLLNLPRLVSHSGSGNSIQLDYTFGGEKIRKISPEGTRIYLGGVEYLDNSPESLTHSDGRVDLSGAGGPKHQFSIKDHLGNTVVLFEDANNDGAVSSSEVLQRNLYYPFGLELKGEWNSATSPRMDYLYNGKEFNEELELNWLDYGFRWYDPAVGRFPSVDPLADRFAHVSPFNYAENEPIAHIDLWGLQQVLVVRNEMNIKATHVNDNKRAIDAVWQAFHDVENNSVQWRAGKDAYNSLASNNQPWYKGTLIVDVTNNGVELTFLPEVEGRKERNGITLLTGSGLRGEGSVNDPEGTSSAIIDELFIPGGGLSRSAIKTLRVINQFAEGADDFVRAYDVLTSMLNAKKALNKWIDKFELPEFTNPGDTVICPTCEDVIIQDSSGSFIHPGTTIYGVQEDEYPEYNPDKREK